ncbi:MAG: hypothetical protein NC548_06305 [Lachnospiraceae bacterium]|nr:hypothetical protein [Lachnospiraceae bacterium]
MSILNDILNTVGQGLTDAIGDNGMNLLTALNDPDGFDSREELSECLEGVFGDDLSSLFDRRELAAVARREAKTADDKACDALISEEPTFVNRALEIFGEVRGDVLDVTMHTLLKSEFGEGIRDRIMPNINAAIAASVGGDIDDADSGLIPDNEELDDDPPLTDDLEDSSDDDDIIYEDPDEE